MYKHSKLATISAAVLALLCPISVLGQDFLNADLPAPESLPAITQIMLSINRKFVDRNVYTVKLRLGSTPSQPVELVLATNTEWTMVTATDCDSDANCLHGAYSKTTSTTETVNPIPIYTNITLDHTPIQLVGENVTDQLYLPNGISWIDQNFPFFLIHNANNTFPYDGILGLSPDVNDGDYLTLGSPIPLHLKKTGKIDSAVVAIDMHRDTTIDSTITFGGYDVTKFRNTTEKYSDLVWFDVPPKTSRFAWTREVKNIFYNGSSYDDGYYNTGTFDSFFGGIHLPVVEWNKIFGAIQTNLTAAGQSYLNCDPILMQCSFTGICSAHIGDFSNIDFNFVDERGYTVTPMNYLIDTKDQAGRNICNVAVFGNRFNATEYILGDVFMQSMYVILDYDNSRFAVNGNYVWVDPIYDKPPRPIDPPSTGISVWVIVFAVVGVLLIVGIVGFFIVRQKNRRLQNNLAKYEQL